MIFSVFRTKENGKWWELISTVIGSTFSDAIEEGLSLDKPPKKIKFKVKKKDRKESISFTVDGYDYKIVNWENEKPSY